MLTWTSICHKQLDKDHSKFLFLGILSAGTFYLLAPLRYCSVVMIDAYNSDPEVL